jgi:AGCS family alanine or glycine:cation symporter
MAVLMLFPVAMRVLEDYRAQLAAGIDKPVFKAEQFPDLNIDRSAWK